MDQRPSKDEISELYNKKYCKEHFVKGGKPGTPEFDKRLSLETHHIQFFRGIKRKGKVLDIGRGFRVIKTKGYHSEAAKMNLKRFPVISIFARLIAKMYSGHSVAVVAERRN